ncbi:MAG: hypothetical protein EKK53_00165 [Burkholderiales bacterium]|nr:MAG: hypothetical protein EKK53_00165 [Burkholderiales bacterium]
MTLLRVALVVGGLHLGSIASAAETRPIDAALNDWPWRRVGDPLPLGQQGMLVFGLDDRGAPIGWRLHWADNTATSFALPGLVVDKDLRYTTAETSAGLWLAGPSIALLRPDGRLLQAPLKVDRPPLLGQPDGSLLVFKDKENERGRKILSVRLAADGNSLVVKPLAPLSYDGRVAQAGQITREPNYGHSVLRLLDGRVLMFGGDITDTQASTFDPASGRMTPVAPMPHPRVVPGATVLADGRVVVAGAERLSCYRPAAREVDLYDPQANAWVSLPPLPLPLCAEAYGAWRPSVTQASDGSLVLGGGLEPELLMLPRDARGPHGFATSWQRLGFLPRPRIGGVVQPLPGGRLVVVGGVHNPGGFGDCCERTTGVDRLSVRDTPAAFGPSGLTMNGPGVARRGMRLFVAGGRRFVTTDSGQMRFGSQAEIIDLRTGQRTQLDAVPVVAGALDAFWLDDDRVLVKGRLARDDRGFDGNLASYMPDGSGAMALLRVSTGRWTRIDRPDLAASRLFGVRDGQALLLQASGGLLTWRPGDAEARPGPATVGGGVGAQRVMPDGRVVLAANLAPSDIVSVLDPACDAAPDCRERFVGVGPQGPARLTEVVKLGDPGFHLARRRESPDTLVNVDHAIDAAGRIVRLSWAPSPSSGSPAADSPVPGWHVQRARDVTGAAWDTLPLPAEWLKGDDRDAPGEKACGRASGGDRGLCQVLALDDPRDASGQRSLLFLRRTEANLDRSDAAVGSTTVWWFDEAARRWLRVVEASGLGTRHAVFDLPATAFPGKGRLRSIGWHLEQPVLWVD